MSYPGDVGKFELFNLKDMWKKIKKHPESLLVGAADPFGNKLWSGITGHDFGEPVVDQMGGAYGGKTISVGKGDEQGGVYGRAEAAGVPTSAGANMQNLAHVIAAMYAMHGLKGMQGGSGGSAPTQGWQQYMRMMPQSQGQKQADPYQEIQQRRAEEEDPYAQMLAALMQQQAQTEALGYG